MPKHQMISPDLVMICLERIMEDQRQKRPSHHFLVQSRHHLFQFLVSFFEVLLCSLQGIQFRLSSVHFLFHSPAKLVTHG